MLYDRLDGGMLWAERRLGLATWPLIGLFSLGLASLYLKPGLEPEFLGAYYLKLSQDPFAFSGRSPVGFRILTPTLAWFVGLRGDLLIVANWAIAALFLTAAGSHFHRVARRPGDAVLAVMIFAFSTVTLGTISRGYYCDSTTYLLVLALWITRGRPVFYVLFLLALLNHESVAFLVPFFVTLTLRESQPLAKALRAQAFGFAAAFTIYFGFRAWVSSQMYVGFTLPYYFVPFLEDPLGVWQRTYGKQTLGFLSVFKALWLVPLAAAVAAMRRRRWGLLASWAVLLASVWAQLLFAYDSSRSFTLAFPLMVVALEELYRTNDFSFRRWLPALFLANLAIPQFFTVGKFVWMASSPSTTCFHWLKSLF